MFTSLYLFCAELNLSAVTPPGEGWGHDRIVYENVTFTGSDADKTYTVCIDPQDTDEYGVLAGKSLQPFCNFQQFNTEKTFKVDFRGARPVPAETPWDWSWGRKQLRALQELSASAQTDVSNRRDLFHVVERRLDSESITPPPLQDTEYYRVRFTNLSGESRVYYGQTCAGKCPNSPKIRYLADALSFEKFAENSLKSIEVWPCPDDELPKDTKVLWGCFEKIAFGLRATEEQLDLNAQSQVSNWNGLPILKI